MCPPQNSSQIYAYENEDDGCGEATVDRADRVNNGRQRQVLSRNDTTRSVAGTTATLPMIICLTSAGPRAGGMRHASDGGPNRRGRVVCRRRRSMGDARLGGCARQLTLHIAKPFDQQLSLTACDKPVSYVAYIRRNNVAVLCMDTDGRTD